MNDSIIGNPGYWDRAEQPLVQFLRALEQAQEDILFQDVASTVEAIKSNTSDYLSQASTVSSAGNGVFSDRRNR